MERAEEYQSPPCLFLNYKKTFNSSELNELVKPHTRIEIENIFADVIKKTNRNGLNDITHFTNPISHYAIEKNAR